MIRQYIRRLNTNLAFSEINNLNYKTIILDIIELPPKPELLKNRKNNEILALDNMSICPFCNGSGKICNKLEIDLGFNIKTTNICKKCNGKGYVP